MLLFNLISIVFATFGFAHSSGVTDDAYHHQQTAAVSELREQLEKELSAPHMKEDYWLNNWLRKHNFDVQETVKSVRKHLQLRKEENLDELLNEDWTDMRVLFPYSLNTFDKSGKPVLYLDLETFDLASFLTSNRAATRLQRYMQMMHEEAEVLVRRLRAEGRNISQYNHVINTGGFSISKYGCLQCLVFARDFANLTVDYVPVNIEKTVLVNVPSVYKMLYSLLGSEVQNNLKLYGQDKVQWEKVLLHYIDRDQLPSGILEELEQKDNELGLITWNTEL